MGGVHRRRAVQWGIPVAVLVVLLIAAFFLFGGSREDEFRDLDTVRLFDAMAGPLTYAEVTLGAGLQDVVAQECPRAEGEVVRGMFSGSGSSLVIYAGEEVECTVLRAGEPNVSVLPESDAPEGVALLVNGEPVSASEVAAVAQELGEAASADAIINRVINDALITQEANAMEIGDAQIAQARASVLAQIGIDEEGLPAWLAERGLDEEGFDGSVAEQARLAALLEERLGTSDIEVTDESARAFYLENPNVFMRSEQATMRHIFVRDAAKAQQVAELLNSTDFCELVDRFSDDEESIANCGVYVIPRGVVHPDVEYASFSTPQGQIAVVQTEQGFHFVQSLQVAPSQVSPYSEIGESLKGSLVNSVFQERLNLYMTILRGNADIVIFTQ